MRTYVVSGFVLAMRLKHALYSYSLRLFVYLAIRNNWLWLAGCLRIDPLFMLFVIRSCICTFTTKLLKLHYRTIRLKTV